MLVEVNLDDEVLSLRVMNKVSSTNQVIVVHDGAEALDDLFGTGTFAIRRITDLPAVFLLDLKLLMVDGLEVFRRLRGVDQTRLIPVVILTNSIEEQDIIRSLNHHLLKTVSPNKSIQGELI